MTDTRARIVPTPPGTRYTIDDDTLRWNSSPFKTGKPVIACDRRAAIVWYNGEEDCAQRRRRRKRKKKPGNILKGCSKLPRLAVAPVLLNGEHHVEIASDGTRVCTCTWTKKRKVLACLRAFVNPNWKKVSSRTVLPQRKPITILKTIRTIWRFWTRLNAATR